MLGTGATVETAAFDQRIGFAVSNHGRTKAASEAFGVELVVASDHHGARNHVATVLAGCAELGPIVCLAIQLAILFKVPVGERSLA